MCLETLASARRRAPTSNFEKGRRRSRKLFLGAPIVSGAMPLPRAHLAAHHRSTAAENRRAGAAASRLAPTASFVAARPRPLPLPACRAALSSAPWPSLAPSTLAPGQQQPCRPPPAPPASVASEMGQHPGKRGPQANRIARRTGCFLTVILSASTAAASPCALLRAPLSAVCTPLCTSWRGICVRWLAPRARTQAVML